MKHGRSVMRARRRLLALVAAALIVVVGPAGIAAAQCLTGPAGHSAHAVSTSVAVHDYAGQAQGDHGRAPAGHGDADLCDACLSELGCCGLHCATSGSSAPRALPLTTPLPASAPTPVTLLSAPSGTDSGGSSVLPVPPWIHPTLEQLTVLRV